MNSPPSATIVPSLFAPTVSRCIVALRLPAAVFSSRRVSAQRTGPARALRELRGDERVLVRAVLRAEAAAHVLADDAHLVARHPELLGDRVADAPDVLRRDVDVERVAHPLADRLMRLHRVVQDDRRSICPFDDDVRLGERALEVAALVARRRRREQLARDRFLGIEDDLELLPLDRRRRRAPPAPARTCRPRPLRPARPRSRPPPRGPSPRPARARRARREARAPARSRCAARARARAESAAPRCAASPAAGCRR